MSKTPGCCLLLTLLILAALHPATAQPVRVGEHEAVLIESPHPYPRAAVGDVAWRQVVHRPQASYLALHFARFELATGDRLEISHPAGLRRVAYTGRGRADRGTFWATHMPGDTAVVELVTGGRPAGGFGVVIARVARGFPADQLPEELQPQWGKIHLLEDDSKPAQFYEPIEPAAYERARAVARLLINGIYGCSGWLVGSEGHLMTNNHCIADEDDANNTDYEFMAEGDCLTNCDAPWSCPGKCGEWSPSWSRS